MLVSVILPTHNPRAIPLERTLQSLREQCLPKEQWELLLIDNKSSLALSTQLDISWHPNGHIILEETLGLTPARLAGISSAKASLIVFVDDDNVLASNYLDMALAIANREPRVGAWGGAVLPEFEQEAPKWTRDYWFMLALRECDSPRVAFDSSDSQALPCGAGLCVRSEIAKGYAEATTGNTLKASLDRKGGSLASSGDTDIAYTALDMGYGIGIFPELSLVHLIPPGRLEPDYLVRLWEDMNYSHHVMVYLREGYIVPPVKHFRGWLRRYVNPLFFYGFKRRMHQAYWRGIHRATETVKD